jgi:hypothetical protein
VCPEAHGRGGSVQVSWCQYASLVQTPRGHDLVAEVCRDATTDGSLTFGSVLEVELTVADDKGRAVWTWSAGRDALADPHVLAVQRGHCWDWTAPWTDVDGQGRPLPSGGYLLVVGSDARELDGAPPGTTSFVVP